MFAFGPHNEMLAKIAQRAKKKKPLKSIGMKHKALLITRFGFKQGFIQYLSRQNFSLFKASIPTREQKNIHYIETLKSEYLSRRNFSLFKVSIPTREQKNIHYIETLKSEYSDIPHAIFWLSIVRSH